MEAEDLLNTYTHLTNSTSSYAEGPNSENFRI